MAPALSDQTSARADRIVVTPTHVRQRGTDLASSPRSTRSQTMEGATTCTDGGFEYQKTVKDCFTC